MKQDSDRCILGTPILMKPEKVDFNYVAMTAVCRILVPLRSFKLSMIAKGLRTWLGAEGQKTCIRVCEDVMFCFPAYDDYWGRYLLTNRLYEPEIQHLLERIDVPYAFVDCGANFGYWSVLVSSKILGSHPTVAVEASSETFGLLSANCDKNDKRFVCVNNAICDHEGYEVLMSKHDRHGSRSIVPTSIGSGLAERVSTTTIDSIIAQYLPEHSSYLCKIDVEGAEISAFEGATRAMSKDFVAIYEDHGKDMECQVSRYLLDKGLEIYAVTEEGELQPARSIEDVSARKTCRTTGYNFVVVNGQGSLAQKIREVANCSKK